MKKSMKKSLNIMLIALLAFVTITNVAAAEPDSAEDIIDKISAIMSQETENHSVRSHVPSVSTKEEQLRELGEESAGLLSNMSEEDRGKVMYEFSIARLEAQGGVNKGGDEALISTRSNPDWNNRRGNMLFTLQPAKTIIGPVKYNHGHVGLLSDKKNFILEASTFSWGSGTFHHSVLNSFSAKKWTDVTEMYVDEMTWSQYDKAITWAKGWVGTPYMIDGTAFNQFNGFYCSKYVHWAYRQTSDRQIGMAEYIPILGIYVITPHSMYWDAEAKVYQVIGSGSSLS